jgi:melanoma-associated antigen p97
MIRMLLLASFLVAIIGPLVASGQSKAQINYAQARTGNDLMWCVISAEELAKCVAMAEAIDKAQELSDFAFGSYYRQIKCKQYFSKDECMRLIDDNSLTSPNIMSVDAGEVFVGGRYHSLVPIVREVYDLDRDFFHSLAVVKKNSLPYVNTMSDLRGLKACFAKVGSLGGWTIPIYKLMDSGVMNIVDCNNHVKSAIDFFGISCAVSSLHDRYNPLGDNPHNFCELCGSSTPGVRCTNRDPYAGYAGAFNCLRDRGDIAFLNEKTVFQMAKNPDDYELLCPTDDSYGTLIRRPVSAFEECSWGIAPGNAVVVSSAMDMEERIAIQILLQNVLERYGGSVESASDPLQQLQAGNIIPEEDQFNMKNEEREQPFRLLESAPRFGLLRNLLFSDTTRKFANILPNDMSYKSFLGQSYGGSLSPPFTAINGVRKCPVGQMTLCVTSEAEMIKCVRMRTALNAQLLEPKMSCKRANNALECMSQIRHGEADVTVLDAGDVYRAGWQFGLIPIMAEVYNLGDPYYYAVAVTKQRDNSSELIYLKNKRTCHPAVGHGGGWVIPMAWLLTNERVRDYGCDSVRAAAEYFAESCAPGAQSSQFQNRYEADFWEYSHLCDLCHGSAGHYCKRNHMEDYFGHTGAFRCLVEGGGNVAFVKHTTVTENCDGKRKSWWARNQLTSDYELLCRDGTRAPARDYKNCYLGKVKANAIVTSPSHGKEKLNAFINLFKYAQQFYGQKVPDEFSFSMFISHPPYADLIFQDATQQLVVLPEEERHYTKYLDREFLKAVEVVECRSTASTFMASSIIIMVVISLLQMNL